MKTVGVYEAKTHLARLLDEVERGASITITRHGRPIATLRAVERPRRSPEELMAAFREFRARHPLGDVTVRDLIEEGRKY